MAATNSLVKQLKKDFPAINFQPGDDFRWSPEEQTVYYDAEAPQAEASLLHETAHADLQHRGFNYDVNLLQLERQAWSHANQVLAPRYKLQLSTREIEASLDTYRDWLHARSLCPGCRQTGLQEADSLYTCLNCHQRWQANDARRCALRRIKQHKKTPA